MACSRGPYGKCTRCGITHARDRARAFGSPAPRDQAKEKAIKEARRRKGAYQTVMEALYGKQA